MAKSEKQTEPQAQESAAPVAGELPTIAELAVKHGHTFHRRGKDGNLYPGVPAHDSIYKRTHLQADVLHGWTKTERHTSIAVRLSDEDYKAAIEAAKTGKTHAPANKRAAESAQKGA